jgi:anti-sigma-K factor RskA
MTSLCASIDTLAMTYLDDELAEEELRDFEMHMIDCAGCRARVDAEREALADLRSKLAPPATPDVVRARLFATLDGEDERTSREERKSRVAGWLLPGAASFAAVAALALFAWSRLPADAPDSVASDVARTQMQSPRVALPVIAGEAPEMDRVDVVAIWGAQFRDREVIHQLYWVRERTGDHTIQASVFDARGLEMDLGERIIAGGRAMWVVEVPDLGWIVMHRTAEGIGMGFSSPDLAPEQLVNEIVQYGLLEQVARNLRR